MPGVWLIEIMGQLSRILFLSQPEYKGKIPIFLGIDKVRFRKQVVPGDRLDISAKVLKLRGLTGKMEAKIEIDGELATSGELLFQLVDAK